MYQAQPDRLATLQSLYLELHMQPLYTITSHILLLTTNFIGDVWLIWRFLHNIQVGQARKEAFRLPANYFRTADKLI